MKRKTLYDFLGIGCLTFAAPKEPGMPIEDQSFTVTDRRTDIKRELRWTQLYELHRWCGAVISEREAIEALELVPVPEEK